MKYLKEFFETNFKKIINNKYVHDGLKFENLIQEILNCEYDGHKKWHMIDIKELYKKNCRLSKKSYRPLKNSFKLMDVWIKTLITHDGGKDFVFVSDNFTLWAECKNYEKKLSLKDISNTLIYAHINNIKEVLIFSYSKLNDNARQSITKFFKYDNKVVRIIDDELLENLILAHYDSLKPKYENLPNFNLNQIIIDSFYNANIYELKLDRDNVSQKMDLIPKAVNQVSPNSIIGIDILIKNNNFVNQVFSIEIDFGKNNFHYIKLLDNAFHEVEKYQYLLSAHEQKNFSFYYKISTSKDEKRIMLPEIRIKDLEIEQKPYVIQPVELKITNNKSTNYVGKNRIAIRNELKEKFNNKLKGLLIYGRSGAGKSRILQELLINFAINETRIVYLNIKDWEIENSNEVHIFKKLLFKLLNVPYDYYVKTQHYIYENFNSKYKNFLEILNNPYVLIDDNIKFKYFFDQINNNTHGKICLAIDNLQFLSPNILKFLLRLAKVNAIYGNKLILIWTLNTDYLVENGSLNQHSLMQIFQLHENYQIFELGELADDDIDDFISEVLRCNLTDDTQEIKKALGPYCKNPYILKIFIEWLKWNELVTHDNNGYHVKIKAFKDFVASVNEQSSSNCLPLKKIWDYYVLMSPNKKEDCLIIMGAVHFLGKLQKKDFDKFGLSLAIAEELCKLHFLKCAFLDNESYVFEHDMVELCFITAVTGNDDLTGLFLKHIINKQKINFDKYSPFCQYYFLIYEYLLNLHSCQLTDKKMDAIIKLTNFSDLPCNIEKEYLILHSKFLLSQLQYQSDKIKILNSIRNIAGTIREKVGSEYLIDIYRNAYGLCEKCFDKLILFESYGWFIIDFCNLLSDQGEIEDAKVIMNKMIKAPFYSDNNIQGEFVFLKSCFLNRYGGYLMKQSNNTASDIQAEKIFNNSLAYVDKLQKIKKDWAAEIKFLNYTDLGYLKYYDKKNSKSALKMFQNAFFTFKDNRLNLKTMNSYHKRIMIAMISGNIDEAIKVAHNGISYCYKGKYHYFDGFFMEHYLILQADAYLMRYNAQDIQLCENNLKKVEELDRLMSIKFVSLALQIEGVCAYYNNKPDVALTKFIECYELLIKETNKPKMDKRINQIKYNILKLNELTLNREVEKVIRERNQQHAIYQELILDLQQQANKMELGQNIGKPNGIFTDKFKNFNLPFI